MSAGVAVVGPPFKFDKKEPSVPLGIRLRESLLERVDAVVKSEGISRNSAIEHLLRWALDQYESEKRPPSKKG